MSRIGIRLLARLVLQTKCTTFIGDFSCAKFLFGVVDDTWAKTTNSEDEVETLNRVILRHRNNFDTYVEVLCKLCEQVFGATSCTLNLHSLHHTIRKLAVQKGHPTFEMR